MQKFSGILSFIFSCFKSFKILEIKYLGLPHNAVTIYQKLNNDAN